MVRGCLENIIYLRRRTKSREITLPEIEVSVWTKILKIFQKADAF
jgi:hypothetical protein